MYISLFYCAFVMIIYDKIIQFHFSLITLVLAKLFIGLNKVTFNGLKSNCYQ